jgi:hypothetical protein
VTAAENGLDRNDYKAGYVIWIDGVLRALRRSHLIEGADDALRWIGDPTKTHKVKFFGKTYSVPGREPRRESRDRYMLGDPHKDWMSASLGAEGRVLRGDTPPLQVNVRTRSRGGERILQQPLEIHPLALAIPPMTTDEQKIVRQDIEKNGVRVPLVMYPDMDDLTVKGKPKLKVLDGRHRAYFASVTNQPVQLESFEGTEQEARDHVAALNLHRRQLTLQQRALAIVRLYREQARKEAAEAQRERGSGGEEIPASSPEPSNGGPREQSWHNRAWELAGGKASGVSKHAVKAMGEVIEAPETAAAVERGDIRKTSTAVHQAREELTGESQDRGAGSAVSHPKSAVVRLGSALYELRALKREWSDAAVIGVHDELEKRATEIIELAEWVQGEITRERPGLTVS